MRQAGEVTRAREGRAQTEATGDKTRQQDYPTKRINGLLDTFGRLHFHYSGHGVNNAKINITEPTTSELETGTRSTQTPVGEYLVGVGDGTNSLILFSEHDLKSKLLKLGSKSITITLDPIMTHMYHICIIYVSYMYHI